MFKIFINIKTDHVEVFLHFSKATDLLTGNSSISRMSLKKI